MICTKCNNPGVLNTVNHQDFYYCRTCKEEILLEEVNGNITAPMEDITQPIYLDTPESNPFGYIDWGSVDCFQDHMTQAEIDSWFKACIKARKEAESIILTDLMYGIDEGYREYLDHVKLLRGIK